MEEYEKLYSRLDIHFDTFYGESFYHPIMPEVVKELVERGIAKEDDGAKVVFSRKKKIYFPVSFKRKTELFCMQLPTLRL